MLQFIFSPSKTPFSILKGQSGVMFEITKVIEWDMGHRVPYHKNKCRSPHGHRYRLEVTLSGGLDEQEGSSSQGMVLDFGDLKEVMLEKIHNVLDHGFMVYEKDQILVDLFKSQKEEAGFNVQFVPFIPTAENIAIWCYRQLQDLFPASIHISRCRVFETPNSWADYTGG